MVALAGTIDAWARRLKSLDEVVFSGLGQVVQITGLAGLGIAEGLVEGVRLDKAGVGPEVDGVGVPLLGLRFGEGREAAGEALAAQARMDVEADEFGLGLRVAGRGDDADAAGDPFACGEGLGGDPEAALHGGIMRGDGAKARLLSGDVENVTGILHPTGSDEGDDLT